MSPLLLAFAVRTLLPCAVASANLNADEAVARARAFCTAIGCPATLPASVEYSPRGVGNVEELAGWHHRWQVKFGQDITVHVVAETGLIAFFSRHDVANELAGRSAGPAVPEELAVSRATVAMRAAGALSELVPYRADDTVGGTPATASAHRWEIQWLRAFNGIPYGGQGAIAQVQAETGVVTGLGVQFLTPPPPRRFAPRVSLSQALSTASATILNAGLQGFTPETVELRLVPRNTAWEPGGDAVDRSAELHCAWVCGFSTLQGGVAGAHVRVDAETGAVVGGSHGGIHSLPFAPSRTKYSQIWRTLNGASEVRLYSQARPGIWSGRPAAVASARSDAESLRSFVETALDSTTAAKTFADCKLLVISTKGERYEMPYWSASGVLSSDFTHFAVPTAFREWALAKLASARAASR